MSTWSPNRSWRSQRAGCGLARRRDGPEVDTIVYGTGFEANEYLSTIDVTGVGGRARLHENWKEGAEAYLGLFSARLSELLHALRAEHERDDIDHLLARSPAATTSWELSAP